jgi:hypothetical protein
MPETLLSPSNILLFGRRVIDLKIVQPPDPGAPELDARHTPFVSGRANLNKNLEQQLADANAGFARIYGFSYEGTYCDLPKPALFLVHGPGVDAETVADPRSFERGGGPPPVIGGDQGKAERSARAPDSPSRTGLAAADFSFADKLKVWSYDKADYTIRMDVETGMFEQVLLDIFFGGGGPGVSGARVSGARVSGARVSGARVSGARLSGGSSD